MKWPRCGFRFVTYDTPDTKTWRRCRLAWGHWLMPRFKHKGPVTEPGRVPRSQQ